MSTGASLRFLGAARTVTGSRFLLDSGTTRLLVDCGLYQGRRELRRRNWAPFPVDPASINAMVLTHAHVDHCGFLPALARDGFVGDVLCTPATDALTAIVLPDSGRLHEEEAAYANRKRYSKHHPALPLYTEDDAMRALQQTRPLDFDTADLVGDLEVSLHPAGHILGSSSVAVSGPTVGRLVFSGDLGRPVHPILKPPAPPQPSDVLVIESTYGDRQHDQPAAERRFERSVRATLERGGVVLIPAFAVDRTEVVLRLLSQLMHERRLPETTVYVDSPMALRALRVYRRFLDLGAPDVRPEMVGADATPEPRRVIEVTSPEESKALNDVDGPAVIISASGMATGGRVLHHLLHRLPHARHAVVLVGYQAEGTRGRRLLDGERNVKMLGAWVPVRAEVVDCTGLSVHADRGELIDWVESSPDTPSRVFVVHGEDRSATSLAVALRDRLGVPIGVPELDDSCELTPSAV